MKYLTFILLITSINCFGQDYKTQIDNYRKQYKADFLDNKISPLKSEDFPFLRFYDADSTYRVQATVALIKDARPFLMPVFIGTGRNYAKYALLKMVIKNKPVELTVYKDLNQTPAYADYVFLPFTDETNGNETYAGGRYIDLTTKGLSGNFVIVDFNKAYNPYCAYATGYSCVKPPEENHLHLAIKAGEKLFGKAVTH